MQAITLSKRRVAITKFDQKSEEILNLYGAYRDSIEPGLAFTKFVEMYFSKELLEIDLTCFYEGKTRAGFSAAFFYRTKINGRQLIIARSATGLTPAYQGRGLHNKFDLYIKFVRFAMRHPFTPMKVAAFVINAFVFRDLSRFVPQIFPGPKKTIPVNTRETMDFIITSSKHTCHPDHPFSVEVPIQVNINEALLQRISESTDKYVKWYRAENPDFMNQFGLLVVIDITVTNILGTLSNLMLHSLEYWALKRGQINPKSLRQNIAILVKTLFRKRIL